MSIRRDLTNFTCAYFDVVLWDWPGYGFGRIGPFHQLVWGGRVCDMLHTFERLLL